MTLTAERDKYSSAFESIHRDLQDAENENDRLKDLMEASGLNLNPQSYTLQKSVGEEALATFGSQQSQDTSLLVRTVFD